MLVDGITVSGTSYVIYHLFGSSIACQCLGFLDRQNAELALSFSLEVNSTYYLSCLSERQVCVLRRCIDATLISSTAAGLRHLRDES